MSNFRNSNSGFPCHFLDGRGSSCVERIGGGGPCTALQVAIEFLPVACLLLNREGAVRMMNRRARRILASHPCLILSHDRLIVVESNVAERIAATIRECADHDHDTGNATPKSFIPLPRPQRLPLIFWAAPFSAHDLGPAELGDAWVLLFCHDPEHQITLSETYLRETHGLTRAEARVAALLATGHSVDEIAVATDTTVNAVKFHLKAIYAKTGTHRQSELVASILPSAVLGCYEFR